jgi:hypothetical protein
MDEDKALRAEPADNRAKEYVMLKRLSDAAEAFYENPENHRAFAAWKKKKEENENAANHAYA